MRLLAYLCLALALAGCSSVPPEGATPTQDAQQRYVVQATDNLTFDPSPAKVPVGSTVVWRNDGTVGHDVSGYRGDPIEEDVTLFSSGLGTSLPPGSTFAWTFGEKGSYTVWCHTHHEAGMKQVIHVV